MEVGELRPGQVLIEHVLTDRLGPNDRPAGQPNVGGKPGHESSSYRNRVGRVPRLDADPGRPALRVTAPGSRAAFPVARRHASERGRRVGQLPALHHEDGDRDF